MAWIFIMTSERYTALVERINLSEGARAKLFGVDAKTEQRWRNGRARVPGAVAIMTAWMAEPTANAERVLRVLVLLEVARREGIHG